MSRKISVTDFKAQCLALFDRVETRHETVTILKHGRQIARVVPISTRERKPLVGCFEIVDDSDDLLSTNVRWETQG